MKKARQHRVKIVEKKLGREGVWGYFYYGKRPKIEIDPRQSPKEFLSSLLHEGCHCAFPEATEKEVCRAEKVLLDILWRMKYRRVSQ